MPIQYQSITVHGKGGMVLETWEDALTLIDSAIRDHKRKHKRMPKTVHISKAMVNVRMTIDFGRYAIDLIPFTPGGCFGRLSVYTDNSE